MKKKTADARSRIKVEARGVSQRADARCLKRLGGRAKKGLCPVVVGSPSLGGAVVVMPDTITKSHTLR